ncbi:MULTISPECIES: helix-turn-helix domain-containing protein [unclassified Undibacterium]|uniref:helix-turn-helix domain-containing protein n=1 Tax=unclassified Undibacterium TaxID=2630295 RepID=UPI002AC95DC7|nr:MULTISPECIES: helix-turn-helix domain-containing protein [unclassified Undibacterium]MEB0140397.1 helix-turn-helix domain-containing protein [Undibacterium sp. CCC2.1]MEB0173431.1 helix-turn-helix domain-containing protein [Undibacterium sp. CCC1.1]MEB0177331.1 helix-turn-helix domain-containing protein [Undibacterium sp. CCC3.4]MEB0216588.1 helix-turn-helix domain-containing protein [Undibacterium sp. 5I2]WPX43490.1 helix-turn-helix domain-containing protein [Undibacterium sp. CCC3.4]
MTLPTEPTQLPTRAPHWLTAGPQLLQLPDLFALEVGGEGLQLVLFQGKNISHICFTPGWRGVVVFDQSPVQISVGSALCQDGDISVLTKLQAFMDADCGLEMNHSMPNARLVSCAGSGLAMLSDRRTIENWFLSQMITEPEQMLAISALLRRLESYALVRFLLTERAEKKNLRELAQSYGISYTHFRRLCNRALGGSVKFELNQWRMARALLDLVDSRCNFTEVALKHGYASSSHFSNEVRGQVGVSPRGLSDIIKLAGK